MSLNRNVRLIYTHTVLSHMLFLLPVVVPYYHSIGLSFRDFLLGEAFFSAMILMAEVPSGWISDIWRRKTTLMLGALFGMTGLWGLMMADGFWMATLSQGVIGIAVALNSGTNTALLYDTLADAGKEDEYRRLEGQRHGFGFYGTAISCALGGLLFAAHPKLPLMIDGLVVLGAMIAISFATEPKRHQKSVEKHIFKDIWITMKYALSGHPEVTAIILFSTVLMCTTKLMLWAQQPYYVLADLPVEWFGFVVTGGFIVGGLVGQWSHKMEHWGSNKATLTFMGVLMGAACLVLAMHPSIILGIPLFLTGTLVYAVGTPRINNAINSRVGSERRATVLSTASLMVNFLFIPSSTAVGYFSDHGGIRVSLLWIGGQVLVLSAIGLWLWNKRPERAGD